MTIRKIAAARWSCRIIPFARAHFDGRHRHVGAVAAFRDGFDRGEVLLVVVAVAEKQHVIEAGPAFQAQGVAAEELAGL